jgi:hypothetical protein
MPDLLGGTRTHTTSDVRVDFFLPAKHTYAETVRLKKIENRAGQQAESTGKTVYSLVSLAF